MINLVFSTKGGKCMLKEWIINLLIKKRDKEMLEVYRLRWQKAQLEAAVTKAKRKASEGSSH